ncbi:asparagine synthase (glutamine-hydrolyzing) [Rheinheimera maricola]|uniref:asparagine synthase (glutamine-hydrolyzing) n=1 Tax=Rheinheimera maricola TaxID=2793282 RepID=A0ABS7XC75_9GAMM|nr:asparagine synthase (glutamine-hydrolyzing) [Rheinheimera maricola]MBZ9613163.1 asparagine synthase (glutamine-hydrolyzing) [Rheinheimera maricola]
MCGLSVIYKFQQAAVDPADLATMSATIAHRGPDEAGYAIVEQGKVGLAHVRLSIVDLAHGQQPMFSRDERIGISYNGEIYDAELHRQHLRALGHQFRTTSDTEVLLCLYQEYGVDFVSQLNGEFAFVLWDGHRNKLLVARDRTGVKPLYYHHNSHEVILCSEAKGILALDRIDRALNPAYFLSTPFAFQVQGISAFSQILSLKPAHLLLIDQQGITEHCYWQPNYNTDHDISFATAQEQVEQLLDQAVARRLVADVPVGTYLSGGIDSTLTCAMMARHHSSFKAFNLSYVNSEYDESSLAAKIAAHYGVEMHTLPCTKDDLAEHLEDAIFHSEMLIANPGHVGKKLLSKFARQHGVKVCLTGEGSDEFFAGYAYFKQEALWRMLAAGGEQEVLGRQLTQQFEENEYRSQELSWTKSNNWRSDQHIFGFPSFKQTVVTQLSKMVAPNLYHPDFIDYSRQPTPFQLLKSNYPLAQMQQLDPVNASRLLSLSTLSDYIIPVLGDRAEMANSLECRTPFLDNHLLDFATRLPQSYLLKMDTLREKYLLHEAFKKDLPPFMYQQHKHPFSADDWYALSQQSKRGQALFQHYLSPQQIAAAGIFNPKYVATMQQLWQNLPPASPMLKKIQSTMGVILGSQILHERFIANRIKPRQPIMLIDRSPRQQGQLPAQQQTGYCLS